jgi:hypothetical protein
MALPAGTYKVSVTAKGYMKHEEIITVSDMGRINTERNKYILIKKPKG